MDRKQETKPELSQPGGRWALLSAIAIGHGILHWYQQGFLVVFPTIKADMSLSATQAGKQFAVRGGHDGAGAGLMDTPSPGCQAP